MNELQEFLEKLFGENLLQLGEGQEQTPETALSLLSELVNHSSDLATQVSSLTETNTSLQEKVTNLETQVQNLQEMATVGKNHIASLRETAVENYRKLKGDSVDETIITMLNSETTGLATLISLNKEYNQQLEEKFPMTCSKCGSHDINRASSVKEPVTAQNNEQSSTTQDVLSGIYNSKMK